MVDYCPKVPICVNPLYRLVVDSQSGEGGGGLTEVYYQFFWLCRILVAAHGLFVAAGRLLSSCGAQAPEHAGSVVAAPGLLFIVVHRLLIAVASLVVEHQL